MAEIGSFERFLWVVTILLATGLAALVVARKNYNAYPVFFAYILATLTQNLVYVLSYRLWGFSSVIAFKVAWGTQCLVALARALAVAEISRRVLAKYEGIWALGWRIFLSTAALVLAGSWAIGGHSWQLVAVTADRSLEMAIAAGVAALFLFVRHYEVAIEPAVRNLGVGFFLYSCFSVLNDTILERWLAHYATFWNLLGTVIFIVSLLLWTWALRQTQPRVATRLALLPKNEYQSLSPAINARLNALNHQLGHFWHAEGKNS